MADSDITLSGLTATGGPLQVKLDWAAPHDPNRRAQPYLQFDAAEVWAGAVNNRDTSASKIGETNSRAFIHGGLSRGRSSYYWIRPRNQAGLFGDWHPSSSTAGIVGSESNNDAASSDIDSCQIPNGPLIQWGSGRTDGIGNATLTWPKPFSKKLFNVFPVADSNSRVVGWSVPSLKHASTLNSINIRGFDINPASFVTEPYNQGDFSWLAMGI